MKKVVSLLLVMLMVLGMSVNAFALLQDSPLGEDPYVKTTNAGLSGNWNLTEATDIEARPGDIFYLPLNLGMFEGYARGAVTSTFVSKERITARIAIAAGRQGIANVSLVYDTFGPNAVISPTVANWPEIFNAIVAAQGDPAYGALTIAQKNTFINNWIRTHVAATILADYGALEGLYGYSSTGTFSSNNAANNPDLAAADWRWTYTSPIKTAAIKIEMVRPFVSVNSVDLDFTVYLLIKDRRQDTDTIGMGYKVTGTLANQELDTWASTSEFDGYLDQVAVAQEYAKEVKWDCDHGVFIYTKLFKGKKYYGICTREADERDDAVFAKYPDIDGVYNMLVIGLNSTTDYVRFEEIGGDYYVYDKDLVYLGMSSDKLKFSSKYYISNKKLDLQGDDTIDEPDDDGDEPEDPPITGGNEYPSNVNDNPGTGR